MTEINNYAEAAELLTGIFKFRTDTFAQQVPDGYVRIKRMLTVEDIIEHLQGKNSFGVFPIFPEDNFCYFGVIDLDKMDFSIVERLRKNSNVLGISDSEFLIEASGNKGFHFWYIFQDKLPADKARRFLQAVKGDLHNIEVFPKQDILVKGGFGNLIKLPFGQHKTSMRWSYLIDKTTYREIDWIDYLKNSFKKISVERANEIADNFSRPSPIGDFQDKIDKTKKTEFEKYPGLERVLECDFISYCAVNAKDLPEPLWFSMISNLVSFQGGRDKIHELSQPYKKGRLQYSAEATDKKIQYILKTCYGPHTCHYITLQGFSCPKLITNRCQVKAPAGLGTKKASE
ncbi:MAG TPA: hypothetical protein DCL49_14465 [Candidatus Omnitrophica bacterium]|nr:hypothetical protein [Candidatus Omnitrophota bacterium]